MDILGAIGSTLLIRLSRLGPIFAKLEGENPTGSMKDRVALAMIEAAERDGRLKPSMTVVEYTGGSTGTSLAFVCAAKGYPIKIVTSDAFSQEKRDHMAALGAKLVLVKSEDGKTTKKLILDMIAKAKEIASEGETFFVNQLENRDSIAGYFPLGEEIWAQSEGKVDAFVHSVGSAASLNGIATVLRNHNPKVRIVAVEPSESPVLSGGQPGPHKIEGVGIGYTPPLWDASLIDQVIPIKTDDAKAMVRRLAREEGVFAGTSSGVNVVASLQVARELGPSATVVTLFPDSGLKYLSTDVFRSG